MAGETAREVFAVNPSEQKQELNFKPIQQQRQGRIKVCCCHYISSADQNSFSET